MKNQSTIRRMSALLLAAAMLAGPSVTHAADKSVLGKVPGTLKLQNLV
jgi:hypothetical protein